MAVGVREDGHERTIEPVTRRTPLQRQIPDTLAVNTSSWDRGPNHLSRGHFSPSSRPGVVTTRFRRDLMTRGGREIGAELGSEREVSTDIDFGFVVLEVQSVTHTTSSDDRLRFQR